MLSLRISLNGKVKQKQKYKVLKSLKINFLDDLKSSNFAYFFIIIID